MTRLWRLALPVSLQSMMFSLLGLIDIMMVSQLGTTAVAAVGLGNRVFFFNLLVIAGLAGGVSVLAAQYFGRGELAGVRRSLALAIVGALLVSLPSADARGEAVTDDTTLARIKSLVIPPAWTEVWICPDPNGHIQAVGRDARGRKQYRYHPRWREVRDGTKYARMLAFAAALPAIRARVARDLARPDLDRDKVLATVLRLLDTTHIRIGNPEYAATNDSYGLTTLQDRHVKLRGQHLEFQFRGKSGKQHRVALGDPRLARIVRACRDIPGQDLFQYLDEEGMVRDVDSAAGPG